MYASEGFLWGIYSLPLPNVVAMCGNAVSQAFPVHGYHLSTSSRNIHRRVQASLYLQELRYMKRLVERLEEIARTLPEVLEEKLVPVPHNVAKQHYKNAKPNALYKTKVMKPVDHLKRLKEAHKAGGDEAVTKYAAEQHILAGKQRKEMLEHQSKLREVKTI